MADAAELEHLVALNLQVQDRHVRLAPDIFRVPSAVDIRDALAGFLGNEKMVCHIAYVGGQPAGYTVLEFTERPANAYCHARTALYIHQIGVEDEFRRQGVGKALMDAARRLACERGIRRIELDVWALNTGAAEFFSRQGFTTFNSKMSLQVQE